MWKRRTWQEARGLRDIGAALRVNIILLARSFLALSQKTMKGVIRKVAVAVAAAGGRRKGAYTGWSSRLVYMVQ